MFDIKILILEVRTAKGEAATLIFSEHICEMSKWIFNTNETYGCTYRNDHLLLPTQKNCRNGKKRSHKKPFGSRIKQNAYDTRKDVFLELTSVQQVKGSESIFGNKKQGLCSCRI